MLKRPMVAVLIAVFLAVVVGALGYFLLVGPKKGSLDTKQKEIESTENKIEGEKNTYKELVDIKNRSAEYEAKLASLQAKIPEEPELPTLIRNLQAAADVGTGAGLPWLSFTPGPLAIDASGGQVSSYTFTMLVGGFYDEVVDLVYRIESMQRAVAVNSVMMTTTESILQMKYSPNLGLIQATIDATAYTLAQPPGAEAATSEPKPESTDEESTEESSTEEESTPEMENP